MTFSGKECRPEWECEDCGGTDCQLCQAEWSRQQKEIRGLDALEAAREFIERYSDVVDGPDGPEPNKAMQIVAMIDEVLA